MTGDIVPLSLSDGDLNSSAAATRRENSRLSESNLGEIEFASGWTSCVQRRPQRDAQCKQRRRPAASWVHARAEESSRASRNCAEFLDERVPDYMIQPPGLHTLKSCRLMPNGKIDRANLPPLGEQCVDRGTRILNLWHRATTSERRLQTIWEEILDVRPIGVRHEFFALGGHSLSAARVLFKIKREFSSDIPLAAMFQAPTIEGLAAKIRGDSTDEARFATVPIQPHGSLAPLFVVGGFPAFTQLARHLGEDQPLIGLTVPDELKMRLPYNLAEFAAHQVNSILRVQKDGPYLVAGFSAEGTLAYEVAQQLKAAGREVGLLVMVDTSCPAQPLQPLVVRMAHNARVHLREARSAGLATCASYSVRNISESSAAVQVFPMAASQQGGRYPEDLPLPRDPRTSLLRWRSLLAVTRRNPTMVQYFCSGEPAT